MMSMKVALGLLLVAGLCAVTHAMSIFPEEFSARLTVKHGPQEYAAALYVKNDNKDHILWVKVQSGDKEGAVRTVYKSDTAGSFNLIKAGVDPKGQLDLERADCDNLPLGSIIDLGGMSFIPRPVEEAVPKYKKLCKDCDSTFVFEVRNRFFILLAAGSSPKFVVGADDFIATVVSFAPGKSDDFKEDVAKSCAVLVSKVKSMDKDKTHMPADQAKLFTKKKTLGKPLHKFDGYADAVVAYMFGDALKIKMGEEELPVKKDPKPDRPSPGGRRPEAELVPPVRFAEARVGRCTRSNIGDGKCDPDCNTARYNYDAGDCCEGSCKLYEYYVSVLDITHPVHQYRQHICGAQGYSCSAPPKATCGFFHGFMNAFGQAAGSPNAFGPGENPINGHYWANMANEMEGICNTVAYNNHETVNTGWNNTQLQLDYYTYTRQIHLAAARSRLRPAVFAHSMANMLLTGACLDQGHCDVKWYDLSGPIRGSRAAENAIGVTAIAGLRGLASAINWIRPGTISGVLKAQDTLAPSFRDLATDTAHPDRLSSVAGGSVAGLRGPASPLLHGAACGYKGISSWTSPVAYVMATVKTVVYGYNALSDGVVGMDECELYRDFAAGNPFLTQFGAFQQDDPLSPWYHFPGNHQSATGGLGEGDAARVLTYMRAQADGFPQLYIMYLRTRRLI